jgi:LMBR1 domain-containing protein 1
MYQLGYIATGLLGVIGVCLSGCWLAHIIVYMLPPVPIHPLLNDVFIKLDGVFPLFGVAAFAGFCAYLMGASTPRADAGLGVPVGRVRWRPARALPPVCVCVAARLTAACQTPASHTAVVAIKGNFLLGLNFLVVSLYPIRVGATLMSSFLVNTALILAMACAVIQFCASAFSAYANATQIFDIFGSQVRQDGRVFLGVSWGVADSQAAGGPEALGHTPSGCLLHALQP